MSEILFYYVDCDHSPRPNVQLPPGVTIDVWLPNGFRLAPDCGLSWLSRAAWPAFHSLGVFGNQDHRIIRLQRDARCVHRTMLIPPFFRFPFMASDDLQCGDIWTHPSERGIGLATAGVLAAEQQAWRPGRRIWYLTESGNEPSQRLALHTGFSLLGRGLRTRRLGFKIFGQFVLTTVIHNVR